MGCLSPGFGPLLVGPAVVLTHFRLGDAALARRTDVGSDFARNILYRGMASVMDLRSSASMALDRITSSHQASRRFYRRFRLRDTPTTVRAGRPGAAGLMRECAAGSFMPCATLSPSWSMRS
jgi:hypothetical protein